MTFDKSIISLNSISKDIAKLIGTYAGNFFPLSSISRKFRGFFQEDLEALTKQGKIILSSDNPSFFLTFEGDVYACGSNQFGQLGLGDEGDRPTWTKTGPLGKKVIRILTTFCNSFAFCDDGVYACGGNDHGQISFGNKTTVNFCVKIGPSDKKVLEIVPTLSQIFVRCVDGWYGSGNNSYGIFGTGSAWHCLSEWIEIKVPGQSIFELIAHFHRAFVRCEDGWYGCGSNQHFELGTLKAPDKILEWVKIAPCGKTVLKIIPTLESTFVCCEDGWYACGNNIFGQFGTGDTGEALKWIKIGLAGKNILELQTTRTGCHTFIRCEDGWYGCGLGFDQANDDAKTNYYRPHWTKIEFPGKKIFEVKCEDISNIFIRCDDGWYARGRNTEGQLGVGEIEKIHEWVKIGPEGKKVLRLYSDLSTFILCKDGWYACGSNSKGQLATGDTQHHQKWIKVPLPDFQPQPTCFPPEGNEADVKLLKTGSAFK